MLAWTSFHVPRWNDLPTLNVRAHLGGLRGQPLADVALQLLLDHVVGEGDVVPDLRVGDAELEGVDGVAVFLVQRPANGLVQVLDGHLRLLGDVAHDAVDHLRLVVALLALDNVLGRHTALGQIDVALVLVDTQHDDHLVTADTDELLDGADTSTRQLGEQDHTVDVVCAHRNVSMRPCLVAGLECCTTYRTRAA